MNAKPIYILNYLNTTLPSHDFGFGHSSIYRWLTWRTCKGCCVSVKDLLKSLSFLQYFDEHKDLFKIFLNCQWKPFQ